MRKGALFVAGKACRHVNVINRKVISHRRIHVH